MITKIIIVLDAVVAVAGMLMIWIEADAEDADII